MTKRNSDIRLSVFSKDICDFEDHLREVLIQSGWNEEHQGKVARGNFYAGIIGYPHGEYVALWMKGTHFRAYRPILQFPRKAEKPLTAQEIVQAFEKRAAAGERLREVLDTFEQSLPGSDPYDMGYKDALESISMALLTKLDDDGSILFESIVTALDAYRSKVF